MNETDKVYGLFPYQELERRFEDVKSLLPEASEVGDETSVEEL